MGLKRAIDETADKGTLPRSKDRKGLIGSLPNASVEDAFKGSDNFIINELRPYEGGTDTLYFLSQLDNWNKHNMLILNQVEKSVAMTVSSGSVKGLVMDVKVIGENKTILLDTGGQDIHFHAQPDISLDVVIVSRKPHFIRPLLPFLDSGLKDTRNAVEAFKREFGKAAA